MAYQRNFRECGSDRDLPVKSSPREDWLLDLAVQRSAALTRKAISPNDDIALKNFAGA